MGCTPSKFRAYISSRGDAVVGGTGGIGVKAKNSEELDAEMLALHEPPPKLRIEIGSGIHRYSKERRAVIMIFGGPASMKGMVADELEAEFSFTCITAADIVLSYLPNKVANSVVTTSEIQELLKTDTGLLTVEWILHLISAKISTSNQQLFLIDVVPNLLAIMKCNSYLKDDFTEELSNFERRHPILFALNLIPTPEILGLKTGPGLQMKPRAKEKDPNKPTPPKPPPPSNPPQDQSKASSSTTTNGNTGGDQKEGGTEEEDPEDKNIKTSKLFGEGSDEVDSARLQRRNEHYRKCALPFLSYFQRTDRIVTVEVTTKKKAYINKKIGEFMREQGFKGHDPIHVVLFTLTDEAVDGLDSGYYKMLKVRLSSVLADQNAKPLDSMVKAVRRYIERSATTSSNHLVILDCLNTETNLNYRRLNFLEVRECYLDQFIQIRSTHVEAKPFKQKFKSIAATNGEVCLFPFEMDTDLCKKVAFSFGKATALPKMSTPLEQAVVAGTLGHSTGSKHQSSRVVIDTPSEDIRMSRRSQTTTGSSDVSTGARHHYRQTGSAKSKSSTTTSKSAESAGSSSSSAKKRQKHKKHSSGNKDQQKRSSSGSENTKKQHEQQQQQQNNSTKQQPTVLLPTTVTANGVVGMPKRTVSVDRLKVERPPTTTTNLSSNSSTIERRKSTEVN